MDNRVDRDMMESCWFRTLQFEMPEEDINLISGPVPKFVAQRPLGFLSLLVAYGALWGGEILKMGGDKVKQMTLPHPKIFNQRGGTARFIRENRKRRKSKKQGCSTNTGHASLEICVTEQGEERRVQPGIRIGGDKHGIKKSELPLTRGNLLPKKKTGKEGTSPEGEHKKGIGSTKNRGTRGTVSYME